MTADAPVAPNEDTATPALGQETANPAPTAWLLIALAPDERQHSGNSGYADDPARFYRWDSQVPNWKNIRPNDIAVLRSDELIGVARILRIDEDEGPREFRRCPKCGSTGNKPRKTVTPRYRCAHCHSEFDEPTIETIIAKRFVGHFDGTFVRTPGALTLYELRSACLNYNGQHAMQRIALDEIWPKLAAKYPAVRSILPLSTQAEAALVDATAIADAEGAFSPSAEGDARGRELRAIAIRRGQPRFRKALLEAYAGRCAISGCDVEAALEAAHVTPYRGEHTNHVQNGILLRADIHTLFDLQLLKIEENGTVVLSPSLLKSAYADLHGRKCVLPTETEKRPSPEALAMHRAGCDF